MKTLWTKLAKREDGFSLVELMIVVAIIGILSAVAIPNFRKYQAKSKTSEAKLQLSSLYTAETTFFADFDVYGTCLPAMGYDPSPEQSNRYYAVGFNAASGANTVAVGNGAVACGMAANTEFVFGAGKAVGGGTLQTTVPATNSVPTTGASFIAGATGHITNNPPRIDTWQITDAKVITNLIVGF